MTTIVKATSKGQITLPAKWRKNFSTNQFLLKEKSGKLEIAPLDLSKISASHEVVVFDAVSDNNGQGGKASEFLKVLETTKGKWHGGAGYKNKRNLELKASQRRKRAW